MPQTLAARTVPYYYGPPEAAFGVGPVTTTENTAAAGMSLGNWAVDRATGMVHPGCLGVMVDDVTAYAALTARSEGEWAVSSAIQMDFHSFLPPAPDELSCTAALDSRSAGWANASGQVMSTSGELVATVRQTMRYIPGSATAHEQPGVAEDAPAWLPPLESLISMDAQEGDTARLRLEILPGMRNPLGMLHGGVGLCLAEVAGRTAWAARPGAGEFHTSSMRVAYLRPGSLAPELSVTVEVLHASRSVALLDTKVLNPDGEVAFLASSTLHRSATY